MKNDRFPVIKLREPVSILMPVSKEGDVIEEVVEEWVREVISHLPQGSELLFDEAVSTEGTREILQRLSKKYPFINVDGIVKSLNKLF